VGSKGKKLENDTRARQGVAAGRETELYGIAQPGYKEFAQTGGVSDQEKDLARRQSASQTSGIFSRLKAGLQRRGRIQGGYNPGQGAQMSQLGRQAAIAGGENLRDTNLGLLQQQRQGRMFGISGAAGLGSNYAGEQVPLLGVRTELEKKRRGVLGTIGGGLNIASGIGSLAQGFGD
jgi:hypothetical protein